MKWHVISLEYAITDILTMCSINPKVITTIRKTTSECYNEYSFITCTIFKKTMKGEGLLTC